LTELAAGNSLALAALWDRHASAVRRLLRAHLGTDPAVDDLMQEVFTALWTASTRVRDSESVRPYLYGIALRRVALELRRRPRSRWLSSTSTQVVLAASDASEASPSLEALMRVLSSVTEQQHKVFWLRYVEELNTAEIASALGISESTAKREVRRARDRVLRLARLEPTLRSLLIRLEAP
jgi:RNA polymerase sigma-70 factor (ECF subfamily)